VLIQWVEKKHVPWPERDSYPFLSKGEVIAHFGFHAVPIDILS
jgi:hypothetical protein